MPSKMINDLLNFFRQLIQSQKLAEQLKTDLVRLPQFSSFSLFKKIAQPEQYITIKSMRLYLQNKVALNDRQLYDLFQKFDHRRCGFILYQDFFNELVPPSLQKYLKERNKYNQTTSDIESKFIQLISMNIRSCRVLDVWRKELQAIQPYVIFQLLNKSKTGIISPRELFQFFIDNQQQLNIKDQHLLSYTLKRRCYRNINLEVFCQNLHPLEFGYYSGFKFHHELEIKKQIEQKELLAKQAAEVQENYLKDRRNKEIVTCIHHQAALQREKELERRVQDELRIYRELKFATKKKYTPYLTYQQFLITEKENQAINMLKVQKKAEQARLKEQVYRDRIQNIEVMREVLRYQNTKNQHLSEVTSLSKPRKKLSIGQLQRKIKAHSFSNRQLQGFLLRKRVQKEILPNVKML